MSRLRINGETLVVLAVDRDAPNVPATLTRAEQGIVQLVVEGASTADIARQRGCSVGTVSKHLGAVYRKMGVGSRDELIATLRERARGLTE